MFHEKNATNTTITLTTSQGVFFFFFIDRPFIGQIDRQENCNCSLVTLQTREDADQVTSCQE